MSQEQPNNQQKRLVCPKGMKLPKAIKGQAALGKFATQADRNHYMRSMGIAIHEANLKARSSQRDNRSAKNVPGTTASE